MGEMNHTVNNELDIEQISTNSEFYVDSVS